MAKKMLIDATHAEETRVVVVDGTKVEEFDFETVNKRQLAGNIYLAKITRVEPSLQAAFVEYGGNRHGFLAFSEIHPDYYQIPVADREALLAEEKALAGEMADAADAEQAGATPRSSASRPSRSRSRRVSKRAKPKAAAVSEAAGADNDAVISSEPATIAGMDIVDLGDDVAENNGPIEIAPGEHDAGAQASGSDAAETGAETGDAGNRHGDQGAGSPAAADAAAEDDEAGADIAAEIESVADEAIEEEILPRRKARPRRYKIQEVVKVRQIMLVQVVKEERGNKGAALTTYLSLAGRYCVLMPNTARGGGISRKITNAVDRKKLKEIAATISVPEGAGLIIRTAGARRTKAEIRRDYEYLLRLWEQIRALTLNSVAPAPIYEEGNLIKRSIRDIYNREIDEVLVAGEAGYRTAKDFMKMIMPSHAKNVKHYAEPMPLFARYQVESYLAGMFNPNVQLRSGGYIVIGVTEALVAIDVNSGRSTKEGSIEETALKTNLEAAEEVARQLRLRDLAGLIVIDFIDMEERRNNAAVEKRLKEKLKTDRARIQVGRISGFGLMEMSRQRLHPGMIEATTKPCPHCHGTGLLRSDENLALTILRQLNEDGVKQRAKELLLKAPVEVVNFLFNRKREHIAMIELRYGVAVRIEADAAMISPDFSIERMKTASRAVTAPSAPVVSVDLADLPEIGEAVEAGDETPATEAGEAQPKRRKRRRRRKKTGASSGGDQAREAAEEGKNAAAPAPARDGDSPADITPAAFADGTASEPEASVSEENAAKEAESDKSEAAKGVAGAEKAGVSATTTKKSSAAKSRSRSRTRKAPPVETAEAMPSPGEPATAEDAGTPVMADSPQARVTDAPEVGALEKPAAGKAKSPSRKPRASSTGKAVREAETAGDAESAPMPARGGGGGSSEPAAAEVAAATPQTSSAPKRRGWWSLHR